MGSKGGHSHVDACLYLILDRLKPVDIEFLRSIHQLCNVIPIIVKSDLLSREQEQKLRYDILNELIQHGIDIFKCNYSYDQLLQLCLQGDSSIPPFSISTKYTTCEKNESNKNVKQLISPSFYYQSNKKKENEEKGQRDSLYRYYTASAHSKLTQLKDILFYTQLDHLRHSTVSKFIAWRREQTNIISATSSLSSLSPLYSSISTASTLLSSPMTPSTFSSSSFSSSSTATSAIMVHPQQQQQHYQNYSKMKQETLMIDLENLSYQLTTREISERIQELRKRQIKNVNMKVKEYMKKEQEKMDKNVQQQLSLLQNEYNQLELKGKIQFLTNEIDKLITLYPPSTSSSSPVSSAQNNNNNNNNMIDKKHLDGLKYLQVFNEQQRKRIPIFSLLLSFFTAITLMSLKSYNTTGCYFCWMDSFTLQFSISLLIIICISYLL